MESNQASGITPKPVDQNKEMTELASDWQVSKKCMKERIAVMFNNELMADVHFMVGSESTQRRIPAHKFILATGSPVFYAMFYGSLTGDKEEVTIPDVEPEAFLKLLQYLYCDDVSMEADTVLHTLYAAKKYIMPHLEQVCVEYMETNVDASNACLLLNHSRIFEESELMHRCLDVIDCQTEEALKSDSFTDIDYQTLEQILGRDTLCAKETLIFVEAYRWAEAECTRQGRDVDPKQCREVLGDALYLLRLPTMSQNEFAEIAVKSGLLSKEEIIDVFLFFSVEDKPGLQFPTIHRKGRKVMTCSRFLSSNVGPWGFAIGKRNSIKFSVDTAISVAGFGQYGAVEAAEFYVDIALREDNGTVLRQKRHKMLVDGTRNTNHLLFDSPVQIKANTLYTASCGVDYDGNGYCGVSGLSHASCDDINFFYVRNIVSGNCTTVETGQIPEIISYR